jgi:hypothetical protein
VTDANNVSDTETRTNYITVNAPPGVTLTLGPVADAQVSSSSPSANYGTLASMRTREGNGSNPVAYRTYLKFDVQGLAGTVTGVTLRLYVSDKSGNTQSVYTVDPGWTEAGINYTNAPAIGGSPLGGATASTVNTYVEIPLATSAVTGNGLVSFAVKSGGTDSAIYNTKEAGANPPQLVLTQSGAANTAPTANPRSTPIRRGQPGRGRTVGQRPRDVRAHLLDRQPAHEGELGRSPRPARPGPRTPHGEHDLHAECQRDRRGLVHLPRSATGRPTHPVAAASITINAVNDPPAANPASATTGQDTPVVAIRGVTSRRASSTFSVVTPPANGASGRSGPRPAPRAARTPTRRA